MYILSFKSYSLSIIASSSISETSTVCDIILCLIIDLPNLSINSLANKYILNSPLSNSVLSQFTELNFLGSFSN